MDLRERFETEECGDKTHSPIQFSNEYVWWLERRVNTLEKRLNQEVENGQADKWTCPECRFPQAGNNKRCVYCNASRMRKKEPAIC